MFTPHNANSPYVYHPAQNSHSGYSYISILVKTCVADGISLLPPHYFLIILSFTTLYYNVCYFSSHFFLLILNRKRQLKFHF